MYDQYFSKCPFCGSELSVNPRRGCPNCKMGDRNRSLKTLYDGLAPLLKKLNCLNLTADNVILSGNYFSSVENSVFRSRNHIDITKIERPDNTWDFIACNHVLEHVEDDKAAVYELVRTARKAVQITVPLTARAFCGVDYGAAIPEKHGHYRHYGADFGAWAKNLAPQCLVLATVSTDSITDTYDIGYLLCKDASFAERAFVRLRDVSVPTIVI